MLYLLAVVIVAFRRGLKPAIFTAVIGVLAFDFFFIPPYLTFRVSDTEYLITFAGMIIVGALVSLLVARAHEHADAAQIREKETGTLYALSTGPRGCSGCQFDLRRGLPSISAGFSSGKVCSSYRKETRLVIREASGGTASGC